MFCENAVVTLVGPITPPKGYRNLITSRGVMGAEVALIFSQKMCQCVMLCGLLENDKPEGGGDLRSACNGQA